MSINKRQEVSERLNKFRGRKKDQWWVREWRLSVRETRWIGCMQLWRGEKYEWGMGARVESERECDCTITGLFV